MLLDPTYCDGKLLKRMLVAGGRWLGLHRGILNELNVFPVPDGDTGTNMSLTMRGALTPLLARQAPEKVSEVAKVAARGALLGARGNSGVILSQILHGFASALENLDKAGTEDLARAFEFACKYAYSAVQEPREGTILTVIRKMSEHAKEIAANTTELEGFFTSITTTAREVLISCKDELAVLKNAGVVDAGGLGLIYMFEGMLKVTQGRQLAMIQDNLDRSEFTGPQQHSLESDIAFNYCVEFLISGTDLQPEDVRPQLEKLGNSIVVARTQDLFKVHIHTNTPDLVEAIVSPGASKVKRKVEDMREQNRKRREDYQRGISPAQQQANTAEFKGELQLIEPPTPEILQSHNRPPLVAIASGDGMEEYMRAWEVQIVKGGQTLNPSTQDIIDAIKKAGTKLGQQHKEIVVFANNSNCIAAAKQAQSMCDLPVKVIATKSPAQTVAFLNEQNTSPESVPERLSYGEVTQAVKDAEIDGVQIKKGNYLALWNGKLANVGEEFQEAVLSLLNTPPKKDFSRLVVIAGQDCEPEAAESLLMKILETCPGVGVEFLWGGQPHHPILVSME